MTHIYIGNDNIAWVLGLTNAVDSETVDDATVTGQLKERDGTAVGAALSFSAHGSVTIEGTTYPAGNYRATLEEDLALSRGEHYVLHIDADAGGDLKAHWEVALHALVRSS